LLTAPPPGARNFGAFACEFQSYPGAMVLAAPRTFWDAEKFCQYQYHGHLSRVDTQRAYDKLTALTAGYSPAGAGYAKVGKHSVAPAVQIGMYQDNAKNWKFTDNSVPNMQFMVSHSNDGQYGGWNDPNENKVPIACLPRDSCPLPRVIRPHSSAPQPDLLTSLSSRSPSTRRTRARPARPASRSTSATPVRTCR